MRELPKENEIYRHFKGEMYKIITLAEDSEDATNYVIYRALYGEGKTYARELSMFMSPVDKEKYPDSTQEYRFELQECKVDPGIMEFLECETYEERLRVLSKLHPRITDDIINTCATSLDLDIDDKDLEARYEDLKNCLMTRGRFEVTRLR